MDILKIKICSKKISSITSLNYNNDIQTEYIYIGKKSIDTNDFNVNTKAVDYYNPFQENHQLNKNYKSNILTFKNSFELKISKRKGLSGSSPNNVKKII